MSYVNSGESSVKKLINKHLTMLCLIIFVSSCAFSATLLIPRLENRTLWISDKVAGFEYSYCTKRRIFSKKCKKGHWKTDLYDLNDPAIKLKLKNMGFRLRVLND